MKIGYFVTHYPYKKNYDDYFCGGVGVVAEKLAKEMIKKGNEPLIFTTSMTKKFNFEKQESIKIYRYGTDFRIAEANMSFRLLYKPLKHEVDIVHTHAGNPPAPIGAYWYAKKKNKPFVVTYHGDGQWNWGDIIRKISVYFYNGYLLDKVLSHADVIISPSEYYIDESRVLGKYRDKIVVIPNGVNVKDFDIDHSKEECREKLDLPLDDEIILFLGSLNPHKGPDVLLKAMPKILKNIPNARLVFVGDGGMRGKLEMLSKKLDVEKHIKFVGFVEESTKPLYYRAADVFCLPSVMKSEVFPIVLLEASASGMPMVVSDLDTFKCIIEDGYNGLFTKRRDENNLADAIIYLLENEDVGEKMGKNGRKKVEDYSWERIAEETEKVYEGLI